MIAEFRADADIRGGRIDLSWSWVAPDERPALRLLRRQRAYPTGPQDGLLVLDLADLFVAFKQPWARITRTLYLVPNTMTPQGLRQAEVARYFDLAAASEPVQVVVRYYDAPAGLSQTVTLEEVSRVERTEAPSPPWSNVETLEIFATPGGGPEVSAGQVVVSTGHADGVTPDRFEWIASGDPPVSVDFDRIAVQQTTAADDDVTATPETFQAQVHVVQQAVEEIPLQTVIFDEAFDPDSGDWKGYLTVQDGNLAPETVYYYRLFVPDATMPGGFRSERAWRAAAMATGHYGLDGRLYRMLPALHKQYDEPTPDRQGQGQLRRYLQIFGLALDQVRSLSEGLRARHDVSTVHADALPHLARWIGWEPDQTLDELAQRNDIRFAPEIFETVGTVPNIRALVNRVTGWECRVKEFVHNVFLTNAPENVHLWELWGRRHDGAAWDDPTPLTQLEAGFDGRPVAVTDGGGVLWLFWHSDRNGRREIWLQRLDGVDPAPRRAMLDAPDDAPGLTYTDEYPAAVVDGPRVWLFWDSDRDGSWDIWARPFDGLPGGAPVQLTDHPARDRHPAAVRDGAGQIWLFWQSDRRGPTDIWARVHDGTDWGLPMRLTNAQFRHETPAAAVDGSGRIWLFWSADLGDRRKLYFQIHEAGAWGPPEPLPEPDPDAIHRDEAPTAAFWDGQIWLFWQALSPAEGHSNRDGRWQVWGRTHDGAVWGAPFPLTERPTADKEPAAVVDGAGELRVVWRSQRRGDWYKSRTIDVTDPEMLARMGEFDDRAHYTYDTGLRNRDWYARGAVGLYLTPDTVDAPTIARQIKRVRAFIEPFRPLPVRFVWQMDSAVDEEVIDIDGLIGEEFVDKVI